MSGYVPEHTRTLAPACKVEALESRTLFAVPDGFTDTLVGGGINNPVAMDVAPDGRIFVTEQGGSVRIIKHGTTLSTPFVSIDVDFDGERGLLGLELDPDFESNSFVYVYYTAESPVAHNRVSRFTALGDIAIPGSEEILLELEPLSSATNHNGGAIHFGDDGKLYIAVGENANASNAQTLANRLGKILRINKDGSVPSDNPFFNDLTGDNRAIWALGLRNPFTFDFHRETGRMFINDVGAATFEEINEGVAGANYGWPDTEGETNDPDFRSPVFAYAHNDDPSGCAITGGAFYDPPVQQFPAEFADDYFFADLCGNWIRRLDPGSGAVSDFATDVGSAVDLTAADDGSLLYLSRDRGQVRRVTFQETVAAPTITQQPSDVTVAAGGSATFSVEASGDAPLSYQWQRNGQDINGATSPSLTVEDVSAGDNNASFRMRVTNQAGSVTSEAAQLTVLTGSAPTAVITSPRESKLYRAGKSIRFKGAATDPEDGKLKGTAFSWRVDFHHADHVHPFLAETAGRRGGSFKVPREGETSTDVFFRIHLTTTDSDGLTHSTTRDVLPQVVTISVDSSPSGAQVTLDGQPRTTPFSFSSVVGMRRQLEAEATRVIDGIDHDFTKWNGRRRITLDLVTPSRDRELVATYRVTDEQQ